MIVGLDMGGTHIDAVLIENNKITNTTKVVADYEDILKSILYTITKLLQGYDTKNIKKINLSTTISTNAIIENKISKVGLLIQSGPGLPNDHLKISDANIFIKGYTDHRGVVVKDYDSNEVSNAIKTYNKNKIKDIAIVTKFSTRNPKTENELKKQLKTKNNKITLGHKMSGKLNFPRRVNTAYLNAAVKKIFINFKESITSALKTKGINAPVDILKADGGLMSLSYASDVPVETILSGPAASLMGISALLPFDQDAILLDIGGTTTDMFFVANGVPLFEPLGININNHKTLVRAIFSKSIGIGGDSNITVINNKIKIGPKRLGKPYALGGPSPTPTDAMIMLGLLKIGNYDLAKKAINLIAKQLDLDLTKTANAILDKMINKIKQTVDNELNNINSKPVYTIKHLLENKKIKPKAVNIIGGPAEALSTKIKEAFKLETNYPKNYEVANAIGAALAKTTTEINLTANTALKTLSVPEMDIYEKIDNNFNLNMARKKVFKLLEEKAISIGAKKNLIETEIIEENVFNMIDGFYTKGQNIRIRAQIKPGLSEVKLEGYND